MLNVLSIGRIDQRWQNLDVGFSRLVLKRAGVMPSLWNFASVYFVMTMSSKMNTTFFSCNLYKDLRSSLFDYLRQDVPDFDTLGAVSIRKTVLPGMAIPMLKIRRPNGRLIFNMEITIRR